MMHRGIGPELRFLAQKYMGRTSDPVYLNSRSLTAPDGILW